MRQTKIATVWAMFLMFGMLSYMYIYRDIHEKYEPEKVEACDCSRTYDTSHLRCRLLCGSSNNKPIQRQETPKQIKPAHITEPEFDESEVPSDYMCSEHVKSGRGVTLSSKNFCNPGRLGNKMTMIASAAGIACRNKAKFVLPKDLPDCSWTEKTSQYFAGIRSNVEIAASFRNVRRRLTAETSYMMYDNLTVNDGETLVVSGFRQNFKYFQPYRHFIRKLFTYSPEYSLHAQTRIQEAKGSYPHIQDAVIVGIHARRGDLLEKRLIDYGYVMANLGFYNKSLSTMAGKHGRDKVIFLVASDTIDSVKEMFKPLESTYNIVYLEGGSDIMDMATLSSTDHMIFSGGTYGFWASWLNKGDVIYFSGYCKPHSKLEDAGYCEKCFNLPEWVGIK